MAGRAFAPSDDAAAAPVVTVNRLAATKYFETIAGALADDPNGTGNSRLGPHADHRSAVGDTFSDKVTTTVPQVYLPISQAPPPETITLVVRSASPADRAADVRVAMRRVDPLTAISTPKTMRQLLDDSNADNELIGALFIGFALLALALAAGGIYGVIAYSVRLRQREIGVRLALGAAPVTIGRLILMETVRVTGLGVVAGLGLAWLLAHAAAPELLEISPNDPATFGVGDGAGRHRGRRVGLGPGGPCHARRPLDRAPRRLNHIDAEGCRLAASANSMSKALKPTAVVRGLALVLLATWVCAFLRPQATPRYEVYAVRVAHVTYPTSEPGRWRYYSRDDDRHCLHGLADSGGERARAPL